MTTPVSFPIAKLLKEKGYNFYHPSSYWKEQLTYSTPGYALEDGTTSQDNYWDFERYYAPTIAEVIVWLYEKHDIWISLIPDISSGHQLLMRKMSVHLFKYINGLNVQTETLRSIDKDIIYFLSPTEAYEAAIEYCLTNLIK